MKKQAICGITGTYYTPLLDGSYIDSVGTGRYVMLFAWASGIAGECDMRVHSIQRQT